MVRDILALAGLLCLIGFCLALASIDAAPRRVIGQDPIELPATAGRGPRALPARESAARNECGCSYSVNEPCTCARCDCDGVNTLANTAADPCREYRLASQMALKNRWPLVVAVRCTSPLCPCCLSVRWDEFPGVERGLVVSAPADGTLYWTATLPAAATDEEICAAVQHAQHCVSAPPPPLAGQCQGGACFAGGGCAAGDCSSSIMAGGGCSSGSCGGSGRFGLLRGRRR